ncbi:MAG: aminotransferase class IV [Phycisphaerales bacterium]
MAVFLNGRFVTEAEARVSAFDAGLQHGVGVFETMLARAGGGRAEVFELGEHLERLAASARELGLTDSLRIHALAEAVGQTVERAAHAGGRVRVRVTVTGGDLSLLVGREGGTGARRHEGDEGNREPEGNGDSKSTDFAEPKSVARESAARVDPTVMVAAQPATEYPAEMFERGVGVVIAGMRVNPLDPTAGHKTLNYWQRLRELRAAAAAGMGEALVFQVTNYLAGGCVSNAVVVTGGRLVTPIARGEEGAEGRGDGGTKGAVIASPVLPGITRGWLLGWARERGMEVERRMVSIDDVLSADEVFLTNSGFGVLPVVRVEKEKIGTGTPGEVTRAARGAWTLEH